MVADFEQDDIELKRNLSFEGEGAKAEFAVLIGGLGNAGGGSVIVGPYPEWTAELDRRFDPARVNDLIRSAFGPVVAVAVSRRTAAAGQYVILQVPRPLGAPFVLARQFDRYSAGTVPLRKGTSSRVVTDAGELTALFERWVVRSTQSAAKFRAAYAGKSVDLNLVPGQTGHFVVFFLNTGTSAWARDSTEATLGASHFEPNCMYIVATGPRDQVARQLQDVVKPGQIVTFGFQVYVPADAAANAIYFLHPEVAGIQIGADVNIWVYVKKAA